MAGRNAGRTGGEAEGNGPEIEVLDIEHRPQEHRHQQVGPVVPPRFVHAAAPRTLMPGHRHHTLGRPGTCLVEQVAVGRVQLVEAAHVAEESLRHGRNPMARASVDGQVRWGEKITRSRPDKVRGETC